MSVAVKAPPTNAPPAPDRSAGGATCSRSGSSLPAPDGGADAPRPGIVTVPEMTTFNSHPDLRASDAERERAVEILGRAATEGRLSVDELDGRIQSAYATRTVRELDRLLADVSLDALLAGQLGASSMASDRVSVHEGPGGARRVVSIMGGNHRRGHWRIARRCTVVNVMGGGEIDLCDVELSHPVTQLNVYSVMGGAEIRVPGGVRVQVSKLAFMGGNDVRLGDRPPGLDRPLIRIRLVSIMGGAKVRAGRKLGRSERRRARELRDSERSRELPA